MQVDYDHGQFLYTVTLLSGQRLKYPAETMHFILRP